MNQAHTLNRQGRISCSLPQVSISKLLPPGEGQLAVLVLLAAFGIVPFCFARMSSSPPLLFIWGLLACVIYGVIIVYSHFTVDAQLVWTQVREGRRALPPDTLRESACVVSPTRSEAQGCRWVRTGCVPLRRRCGMGSWRDTCGRAGARCPAISRAMPGWHALQVW